VTLSSQDLVCSAGAQSGVTEFEVRGSYSNHTVDISDADVVVWLSELSINATESPVTISRSTVTLVAGDLNALFSTGDWEAGLSCTEGSNVTLQALELGSLSATGGAMAPGIGVQANNSCGSVTVVNGSVFAKGATGLGSGWGAYGEASLVEALTILGGEIKATGTNFGCGIGSGQGYYGNSMVMNLTIVSGTITASSSSGGSGIGSGSAGSGGASTVEALSVLGGTIRANGVLAGIGSGGEVSFSGTVALICNAEGTQLPIHASSNLLSDASLIFVTQGNQLFGVSPLHVGWLNLTILYGSATSAESEPLAGLNRVMLQIGSLNFDPPKNGD
jgi:hypothetical protein